MTYTPNITELQPINSTSYADLLGLQLGLDRLQEESTDSYIKRLEFAARLSRDHSYTGAVNEISLQLGFEPVKYIHIEPLLEPGWSESAWGSSLYNDTVNGLSLPIAGWSGCAWGSSHWGNSQDNQKIAISVAGIVIGEHPIIPLLYFDKDSTWKWRLLSEIVVDINKIVPATLLVDDGPAFQLARQSNTQWVFSESVTNSQTQLLNSGVKVGSEIFNQSVSDYTIRQNGLLTFDVEPNFGTEITYKYVRLPYDIVGSPISLIGLKDPEFVSIAATGSVLAYQVREFIQALMLIDRSYWTK